MPTPALNKSLKILAVLIMTVAAASPRKASASDCSAGDPWFFCQCARAEAQQCWADYQACGGFFVQGCSDTYSQCRLDSGVDQCE
jgi:hypothetical protein